ncbi:MAG: response regulator transcription factor [Scrofimicrobium sp.]
MSVLKILLVDDDELLLRLIGRNLSGCDDVEVVGTASNGYEAIKILERLGADVDVLLLDVAMPGISGPKTAALVRSIYPDLTIVMFTSFEKDSMLSESLRAGANGFLTKDSSTGELVDSLRRAVAGEKVFGRKPLSLLTGSYLGDSRLDEGDPEFEAAYNSMPPRLREVVVEIGRANTNDQIARSLGLGDGTIRSYVTDVLERTGCRSRTEVAVRAVRLGITK